MQSLSCAQASPVRPKHTPSSCRHFCEQHSPSLTQISARGLQQASGPNCEVQVSLVAGAFSQNWDMFQD
jgi:hypothetical protein